MQKDPLTVEPVRARSDSSKDKELTSDSRVGMEISRDAKPSSSRLKEVPRLLFNRRWWWTTLLVLVGMALLARLGVWQLNRLSQRREENKTLIQQLNAPPVEISGNNLPAATSELIDRSAQVEGEFDYENEIILTQQRYQDRLGEHLITPLIIEGTEMAILVDRGWIPYGDTGDEDVLNYNEEKGASVRGVIQASETISGDKIEDYVPKREWYRVDIEAIEEQLPYSLLPIYLTWLPQAPDIDPPIRFEREIDLSEGSHLSYAIQWFIFTVMLGAGFIALILRSEKK